MATKDEITESLRQVNERLQRLTPQILARPDTKLPAGVWTVRDALCHLAARANGVPAFITRIERVAQGQPLVLPGGLNIDDINQSQIDERLGRRVEELLSEITEGHVAAVAGVSTLEDDLFERELPNFRGDGTIAAGEMLRRSTANHDNTHLDEIEQALSA